MVRQWQQMFYNNEYSASRLGQTKRPKNERISEPPEDVYLPDFVKLAEAHGAVGLRASEKKEVVPILRKALALDRPVVVECMVEPEENVYPMVPPGASLMEMLESMA
jgi:acetolactate synthase-1/2/3 large subunit